jgi:hypothetical protein
LSPVFNFLPALTHILVAEFNREIAREVSRHRNHRLMAVRIVVNRRRDLRSDLAADAVGGERRRGRAEPRASTYPVKEA